MRATAIAALTMLAAFATTPTLADDAMGMMKMMKGGETVAIMPDGHMGTTTMSDEKMMGDAMKMAKPLDHCVMIMTGSDGKAYMIDTSSPEAAKECEKMAM